MKARQPPSVTDDLGQAVEDADYVTEAAPEKLELKRSIFANLVALAPANAILATNTSVIPITASLPASRAASALSVRTGGTRRH